MGSYNHNGRVDGRRDAGRFDALGLLSIGNVHLSRDASLRATGERLLASPEDSFGDTQARACEPACPLPLPSPARGDPG